MAMDEFKQRLTARLLQEIDNAMAEWTPDMEERQETGSLSYSPSSGQARERAENIRATTRTAAATPVPPGDTDQE